MGKIKNVVFDLGGVLMDLDKERAVRRFVEIGIVDIEKWIGLYEQKGIFLELENGQIDLDTYCKKLSELVGKQLSYEEIHYAWMGFIVDVPQYKLDYLLQLRKNYHVYLLSNTNPIIQAWARSEAFSSAGLPISAYFDKIYASYEIGAIKPDKAIFEYMIKDASLIPSETLFVDDGKGNIDAGKELGFCTYHAKNAEDWREAIDEILNR